GRLGVWADDPAAHLVARRLQKPLWRTAGVSPYSGGRSWQPQPPRRRSPHRPRRSPGSSRGVRTCSGFRAPCWRPRPSSPPLCPPAPHLKDASYTPGRLAVLGLLLWGVLFDGTHVWGTYARSYVAPDNASRAALPGRWSWGLLLLGPALAVLDYILCSQGPSQ